MALSLQSAGIVRQKARSITRNPGIYRVLQALFMHLASNKGNPDLQWVPWSGTELGSDGGNADKVLADAACRVYAIYFKKAATATGAWIKFSDHASAASATAGEFTAEFNAASEERIAIFPDGFAQGTGWTMRQDTTAAGSTRTLLANAVHGFALISAP